MKTWVVASLLAFVVALNGAAFSATLPIPRFDVEAACDIAALDTRNSGTYKSIYANCISSEQSAYDAIKSLWPSTEDRVVKFCNESRGIDGEPKNLNPKYYQVYILCIRFVGPGYFKGQEDRNQIRNEYKFNR